MNKTQNKPKNDKTQNQQKNQKTQNEQKKDQTNKPDKEIHGNKRRKKRYRGRGKKNNRQNKFSILLSNLRGFRSKQQSLKGILKEVKPQMVLMNETQLGGKMKVRLEGYTCWTRNRTEQGGGGVATAVAGNIKEFCLGAGEGQMNDEYLITRIEKYEPPLNVINCYSEQRLTKVIDLEEKWKRLMKELNTIRARNEFCLLAGDLNKLVGNDEWGVNGNHPELSAGGKLLRALLANKDWILVNGLGDEVVVGGPFTRVDPATGKLSCLDLFIVNKELRPFISSLFIDSKREITVSRPTKNRGKYKDVYSDHYSCVLTFENLPKKRENVQKKTVKWNLAKSDGWEIYKKVTEKKFEAKEKYIDNDKTSVEDATKSAKDLLNRIKFKSFGKVQIKSGNKKQIQSVRRMRSSDHLSGDPKRNFEELEKMAEEEIQEIRKLKKGKVGQIWELRKRIMGGKKATMEPTSIINPDNGKAAVTRREIKEVTLKYCMKTLENNKPEPEFEKEIEEKKTKVKEFLKKTDGTFETNEKTFYEMISKFKKSGKKTYDFLTKAGKGFQGLVFKLIMKMFKTETFPKDFEINILHMIFKSGRKEILSDNRFIFCKDFWSRAAEGLVVEDGMKGPLISYSSIYQVGGQPGHRSEEMVFVFKSIVAKRRMEKKLIVAQGLDVSKFFDKEMIEDGVLVCQKRKVDPKAIRLWYKLNANTRIQVKTGVGLSEIGKVGAVIAQGTISGALVSQAVLDDAVSEEFPPAGKLQIEYGSVPMAPLLWMDDIQNSTPGLEEARLANVKFNKLLKRRGLALNKEKSIMIIIGSKKQKQEASEELSKHPMMCGDFVMQEKQCGKWLGQYISAQGLEDSVIKTIDAREGKIRGAVQEIAEIVNDWRARVAGGMESAIQLWEACVVPSLLSGAGNWVEMNHKTEKRLNNIQLDFTRLVLQVGKGAPLASLLWESGLLDMGLRVWREKLMLLLHIRKLPPKSVATITYKEQLEKQWPGLAREGGEICDWLGITSVHSTRMDKEDYRKVITKACHQLNEKRLRKQAIGKKKCLKIMSEPYGKKTYFNKKIISEVRQLYRARVGLLPFAGNYSHDVRFKRTDWLCRCGKAREEEQHLTSGKCETYRDIYERHKDLSNDEALLDFFQEILQRRDELDEVE